MSEQIKACKDCKWCCYSRRDAAICIHPNSVIPAQYNYVTGDKICDWEHIPCQGMRELYVNCGPEARYFEPKEGS